MRTVICILLILTASVAHARGRSCYTAECNEFNLWLIYFLGFIPVAIFAVAKRDTKLSVALVARSFVASIVAAIAFLGIAHALTGNDISIALRMFIAGIISYTVFWFCIVKWSIHKRIKGLSGEAMPSIDLRAWNALSKKDPVTGASLESKKAQTETPAPQTKQYPTVGIAFLVLFILLIWMGADDKNQSTPHSESAPVVATENTTPKPQQSLLQQKFDSGAFQEVIALSKSTSWGNEDLNTVAVAYYNLSDYENALKMLRLAEQVYPSDITIKTNLAEVLFQLGDFHQALAQLMVVQKMAPDTHLVSERIRYLQSRIEQNLALQAPAQTAASKPTYTEPSRSANTHTDIATSPTKAKQALTDEHNFELERIQRMNDLAEQAAIERRKETARILAEKEAKERLVEERKKAESNLSMQQPDNDYQTWLNAQQQRTREEAFKSLPMNDDDRQR